MKNAQRIALILMVVAGFSLRLAGSAWADKSTAAHILEFGSGVRPTAMGEAFCGVADDINAIFLNPAGIAWLNKKEISMGHDNYFQGLKLESISGIYPVEDILACVGLNISMLRIGEIVGMDSKGNKIPNLDAGDSLVTLSFAQIMDEDMRLGLGLGIKWIHQRIAEEKASGMACDIGVLYKSKYKDCPYTVGAVVQNIGEKIGFVREKYGLPLNFKIGISSRMLRDKILCAIDLNKPIKDKVYLNIGSEYRITDNIALRAGFNGKNAVDMGMSAGIGVKMGKGLRFDYSYGGYGELGNVLRVSVGIGFDGDGELAGLEKK
ncbi:MAG: PorV/PorQ family protein [Candidatus Desantisbacteria bacterium]